MQRNEVIKKANEEYRYLTGEEEIIRLAELREKAIMDENTIRVAGYQDGEKAGEKNGKMKKNIEIAKKMIKKDFDIETIVEITGLSEEEIKKFK